MANFANDSTDRLRETANKGGEGVQNPKNFANVINECPPSQPDPSSGASGQALLEDFVVLVDWWVNLVEGNIRGPLSQVWDSIKPLNGSI